MNINLTLRSLGLLALVAASTVVIVKPDLIGGSSAAGQQTLHHVAVFSHP